MKAEIQTTTIRETRGDGSLYIGSRTYHRAYDADGEFIEHSEENLREFKKKLKEDGYTEFDQVRNTKTFNRSRAL